MLKLLRFLLLPGFKFASYRTTLKEIPRLLALYDINMEKQDAQRVVRFHFTKHGSIKDQKYNFCLLTKLRVVLIDFLMQDYRASCCKGVDGTRRNAYAMEAEVSHYATSRGKSLFAPLLYDQ